MDKNTMIIIAVASITLLIIGAIVLWLLLRKKPVFAGRIYISGSIKDSKSPIFFQRLEVFNMKDINIIKDIAPTFTNHSKTTDEPINISFGGEQQIKRISVMGMSPNTTISLYKVNGESPFSYTFPVGLTSKEFTF